MVVSDSSPPIYLAALSDFHLLKVRQPLLDFLKADPGNFHRLNLKVRPSPLPRSPTERYPRLPQPQEHAVKKTYKLELEIALDEENEQRAIDVARRRYQESGGASVPLDDGTMRDIPAEEGVADPVDAIRELLQSNDLLEEARVEVTSFSCSDPDIEETGSAGPEPDTQTPEELTSALEAEAGDSEEIDLDEFETGVYLCRWPNGEFSIVKADTRREALIVLDEWAGAHPSYLHPMETCMIDFCLNDLGEIELSQFGEETTHIIWQTCYPELDELLSIEKLRTDEAGEYTEEAKELIRKAVEHERKRLWGNQPEGPEAETEAGRELQKKLGTVGPVADYYVKQLAKQILKSKAGEDSKPN